MLTNSYNTVIDICCTHLQEVGEHAHCGQGNLPNTGFSYDPESFMAAGIGVYNFSWRDMGVPTLHRMLDIVQVWPSLPDIASVLVLCQGMMANVRTCSLLACGQHRSQCMYVHAAL